MSLIIKAFQDSNQILKHLGLFPLSRRNADQALSAFSNSGFNISEFLSVGKSQFNYVFVISYCILKLKFKEVLRLQTKTKYAMWLLSSNKSDSEVHWSTKELINIGAEIQNC